MAWDREVDLLVVGAGGGGLTAALVGACENLRVLVIEKTAMVGGTTATSGGTIWVPQTRQGKAVAPADSLETVRNYLEEEVGAYGAGDLRAAFLEAGPKAIEYLDTRTEVKFRANAPYPDYHPEAPGGATAGRALQPLPFDGDLLGEDFALLRPPVPEFMVLGGMMVARDEIKHLIRPWASLTAFSVAARRVFAYLRDRARGRRGTRLVLGNALMGRLLHSCRTKGVEIAVETRLVELIRDGSRVTGALVERTGKRERIRALRGVVLSTGGCAASGRWRKDALPDTDLPHTLAFEGATGDGLDAAMALGGDLDRHHASPFFWMPASLMRWTSGRVATYPHIRDRPKPGLIAVDAAGHRFVNEANSYHDFVEAMLAERGRLPSLKAHLICDRRFIHEYGLGVIHPVWQRLPFFEKAGYLVSAKTLPELARKIGIDAQGLVNSVEAHNRACVTGVDEAFGKGSSFLNRYNGDPASKPNPCLQPIAKGPFYALAVHPAPIGSSIGLRTDADAQVLDREGKVIAGLYACGNDMSSIMRGFYPGPGITLGPALVFAYRAAMHAAAQDAAAAESRTAA